MVVDGTDVHYHIAQRLFHWTLQETRYTVRLRGMGTDISEASKRVPNSSPCHPARQTREFLFSTGELRPQGQPAMAINPPIRLCSSAGARARQQPHTPTHLAHRDACLPCSRYPATALPVHVTAADHQAMYTRPPPARLRHVSEVVLHRLIFFV